MEINKEKLPIIYQAMAENDLAVWLIVGRETSLRSEPILPVLGNIDFNLTSAILFVEKDKKSIALVSADDDNKFQAIAGIDETIKYNISFSDALKEVLKTLNPKTLGLDYSKNDASADGLTLGLKLMVDKVLAEIDYQGEVVTAHPVIRKVRGMKTASQIGKIRHCAEVALGYLEQVPTILKEGSTSLDIFNFLHDIAYQNGYGMSWTPSQCPGVAVDPNVPAGHMGIIDTPIVKGYVINIDYGVSKDGYCSDLQRMYYVLKDEEEDAPEYVKNAFYTVRDAIAQAKDFIKPGVTGYQVDKIARSHVVSEGFDSWNAALGHQVGHVTHDGGTILANRRLRYNRPELIDVPLDKGNVFTLEPGVEIAAGRIGIEEMVVLTDTGSEWLVPPQQELILVRLMK